MTALTQDRATPRLAQGDVFDRDVAANAVIFAGAIVCLSATGWAVPGSTATTLVADGVAQQPVDNTGGSNGDLKVRVFKGVFRFANSGSTDAITRAEIGDDCYIVDDQTVAKTSGSNTRSIAGKVVDVDAQGVWVRFA